MIPAARMERRTGTARSIGVGALLLFLSQGCAVPDRPARSLEPLPQDALSFLEPDSVRGVEIGDGATYHYAWAAEGPWAIHIVALDFGRCDLEAVVSPAAGEEGGRARQRVSALPPESEGVPVVGVNGDFFTDQGLPLGAEFVDDSQRGSARPAFAWGPAAGPWIGLPEETAVGFHFGAYAWPDAGAEEVPNFDVIGGFPLLLADGEVVGDLEVGDRPAFAAARHPRTGVGLDDDTGRLWLVVVDGRQPPYSDGMTLPEFTQLFHALGVEEALNLDGGGSTTMWVRGQVVNRPSDPTGERPVANSLWVTDLPGGCVAGR
ncbi:MAG: phosphodiester glycosidase family protein [Longimicrobiales bacterium]